MWISSRHRVVARPALRLLAFDLPDDVAAAEALLIGRRSFEERDDGDFTVNHGDRDAETVVAAFLPLAHLRVRAGIHEARMRIERLEHAGDGAINEPVGFDRADVIGVNGAQRGGKDLILLRNLVFDGQGAPAVESAYQCTENDGKNRHGHRAVATHIQES